MAMKCKSCMGILDNTEKGIVRKSRRQVIGRFCDSDCKRDFHHSKGRVRW